jgi:hypothetical protein
MFGGGPGLDYNMGDVDTVALMFTSTPTDNFLYTLNLALIIMFGPINQECGK